MNGTRPHPGSLRERMRLITTGVCVLAALLGLWSLLSARPCAWHAGPGRLAPAGARQHLGPQGAAARPRSASLTPPRPATTRRQPLPHAGSDRQRRPFVAELRNRATATGFVQVHPVHLG
jgi:hypothetical protein